MSAKSNLKKNCFPDSNQIFFNQKLSLEGKNVLPQILQAHNQPHHHEPNFLTVFKKPIISVYDRISHSQNTTVTNQVLNISGKKEGRAVCVVGQPKEFEKRGSITHQKQRKVMADMDAYEQIRKYEESEEVVLLQNNLADGLKKSPKKSDKKVFATDQKEPSDYYYCIGQGNNSELVQSIMKRRQNWAPTQSSIYHFRWEQARPKFYNSQPVNKQLINHLPHHEAVSDKCCLVNNLKLFCERAGEELFRIIPVCFQFNFHQLDTCQVEIKRFIEFFWEDQVRNGRTGLQNEQSKKGRNSSLKKKDTQTSTTQSPKKNTSSPYPSKKQPNKQSYTNKNFRAYKKQSTIVQNEFQRKKQEIKQLHRNLLLKIKSYYIFQDMSNLKKESNFLLPIHYDIYGSSCLWLMKPADMNRGRGIHLFRTVEQLGELLKNELSRHEKGSYIIQKYIQHPMLIDNRKFDIRIFALVTHTHQLFIFKQGYIRTSSTQYDLHSNNYFSHLTNNAIQKHCKKYGQFEEGNILKLNYLFENELVERSGFWEQLRRIVRVSMRAGFESEKMWSVEHIVGNNSSMLGGFGCFNQPSTPSISGKVKQFQIFGYDFMLDANGHLWMIEINTNPCLQLSSEWLKQIIPRMLDDAFKLTIDRIFPKGREIKPDFPQCYPVPGYPNYQNMWEYIELRQQVQTIL